MPETMPPRHEETPQAMTKRLFLVIATALLSVVAMSSAVAASEPTIDPETSVSVENIDTTADEVGATPIEPDPTVVEVRSHAWDRIVVSSDGVTLSIYFWMGIPDCNGLHSVDVSQTDSGISVRLATGIPAGAADMVCIEIAQLYVTTITLEEALITNVG